MLREKKNENKISSAIATISIYAPAYPHFFSAASSLSSIVSSCSDDSCAV